MSAHSKLNMLLIGETGSGKSTLVNYFVNYFEDGSLENLKIAIPNAFHSQNVTGVPIHSEKDLHDDTKSKTGKSTLYNFSKDGSHYGFIDTPGLNDTSGTHKDEEHIANILTAVENTGTIAAIILVINGTVARETKGLKNAMNRMKSAIPDALLNNLIVILTNCSESTANFKLDVLQPWTIPQENVFYMNNNALSKPVDAWINNPKMKREFSYHWENSMVEINTMMQRINELGSAASNAFGAMHKTNSELTAELNATKSAMKELITWQNDLRNLKQAEKTASTNIEAYFNYTTEEQQEYIEKQITDYHNYNCNTCNTECCRDCEAYNWRPFGICTKLISGKCTECGCPTNTHYFAKYKPVKMTRTVSVVDRDKKNRFEQYTKEKADINDRLIRSKNEVDSIKRDIDARVGKIQKCCNKLKKVCSQAKFTEGQLNIMSNIIDDAHTVAKIDGTYDAIFWLNNIKNVKSLLN